MLGVGWIFLRNSTEMLTMSKSLKPGTTISDQISILESRGMSVDTDLATQWLTNVSYYRLSAYWFPGSSELSVGDRVLVGGCG